MLERALSLQTLQHHDGSTLGRYGIWIKMMVGNKITLGAKIREAPHVMRRDAEFSVAEAVVLFEETEYGYDFTT